MRDIRFRAWDGKHMLADWPMLLSTDLRQPTYLNVMLEADQEKGYVLMQFTGLKDKKGVPIYEGDIVRYKGLKGFACEEDYPNGGEEFKGEVKYRYGEFWPRQHYNEVDDGYYSHRYWDFEVIGNIWENPELLP